MPSNFALFARYNAEMNERQFLAGQQLTPEALMQERGAFFGSILGTMNHLIVADTLWLHPNSRPVKPVPGGGTCY